MKDFLSWYQNSGWTKCPTAKLLATGIISKLAQQETPFIASQMCLPDTKVTS